jgi:hypothetical protein
VAQAKLAEFLKEHRERGSNGSGDVSAKMIFGEASEIICAIWTIIQTSNSVRGIIGENVSLRFKRACIEPNTGRKRLWKP